MGVTADRLLACDLLNGLDAAGDELPLGLRIEEIAVLPRAAVGGGFVAELDGF